MIPETVGGLIRLPKGALPMDEMNLIYLILILFLLKEIIRISNKKR